MKKNSYFKIYRFYLLFLFSFFQLFTYSQTSPNNLNKISHQDFLNLLTSSKDSIFHLKDTFVFLEETDTVFNYYTENNLFIFPKTDSIRVKKKVYLNNVHFEHLYEETGTGIHHIVFEELVHIENASSIVFSHCKFNKGITIDVNQPLNDYINYFDSNYRNYGSDITINQSIIKENSLIDVGTIDTYSAIFLTITNSVFYVNSEFDTEFYANNIRSLDIFNNKFIGSSFITFFIDTTRNTIFTYNIFEDSNIAISQVGINSSTTNDFSDNIFNKFIFFEIDEFSKRDVYHWDDWHSKILSLKGFANYIQNNYLNEANNEASFLGLIKKDSLAIAYNNRYKYEIENSFKFEKRLLGSFYDFYKSQYDTDFSSNVYVSLKDLDTDRYRFLNEENPSFKTFFTWKINEILRVLSDYGTSPSKTVITSIYIIFIFAFIYLFFPNSWDEMNKNRLIKRIQFYTRYFRNEESMKDIYEEENKEKFMTFQEFKAYMNKSEKEIPSFFLLLSKPIFYFSSTNYKLASKIFENTDLLKGKWVDLPKKRKIVTSFLMGIWIFILLCFDFFIKFLNAFMLSLNTFTTLGFGEIPTKGLPRYLSILQGFIGWFMLSIFSIALIAEILN